MDDDLADFSEYGQPAVVLRYLPPGLPNMLVDVGAYDGVQGSNSRQFLLNGWRGILVEPIPANFELLRQNSRPLEDVHLFNCAVANRNGRAVISYAARNETGQGASLYVHESNDARREVEVLTLNTILALVNAPQQFGLLMVDTEGGDLEVFQGIDFARYQPAVILTEDFAPKDQEKHRLLSESGYDRREKIGADSVWTSRRLVGTATWPEQAPVLVHQVNPIAFQIQAQIAGGKYCIDEVNDSFTLMRGWAFLDTNQPVPRHIVAIMQFTDGSSTCFRGFRCPRKDVAEHFSDPGLLLSGFKIHLPAGLDRKSVAWMQFMQSDGGVCYASTKVSV